ncbi:MULTISPECIES: hypothetical protein [Pseudomonas]|uniref:hypothetical protein n=1 Tax=Pseudomonas TaxID=286 RepID=UPI0018E80764|nr:MULTISPECIES: hypothetical protein [Pseudomonas]MBJ2288236.1 hypothetical protein [Pseudomonas sp. MF6755]MDH0796300.1 hypothetical protein [Pseudomonas carnis]
MHNYPAESLDIQARLHSLGLMPSHLMLIGGFVVVYGLFETTLERALWSLSESDVAGTRPFTEKMKTEDQFKMLAGGNPHLSDRCNAVLKVAAKAAEDLNDYRNSLVHGYLLALGGTPMFMKNPRWHDVKRNKPVGDAYIDEPFQDLVLVAAWTLFKVVQLAEKALIDPSAALAIENLSDDVNRASSYANETRNLCQLLNSEKY